MIAVLRLQTSQPCHGHSSISAITEGGVSMYFQVLTRPNSDRNLTNNIVNS